MKKNNKKGFTIVELVIVVAVIAILAAVLIPTFSGLVNKANESADIQAVRQMNTALATAGELADIDDVIDALAEAGYNSKKALIPVSSSYEFYWYESAKQIVLVNGETVVFPEGIAYDANGVNLESSVKYIDVVAKTVDDIIDALADGTENIILNNDITLERDVDVTGANVTINLNGHTFDSVQNSNGRSTVVCIREEASLTVENGTFNVRSLQNYGDLTIKSDVVINAVDTNGGGCIRNKKGGNVVIEGGTFNVVNHIEWDEVNYGGAAGVRNDGGTVTIKDGVFNSVTDAYLIINVNGGNMKIEGGTFTAYRGALYTKNAETVVDGGTFAVTADSYSGWTVCHEGTGSTTLNGGEYSHVVEGREFSGCSFEK